MTSETSTVLVSVDRGVGVVTLNRPDQLNAFNKEMTAGLFAAIEDLDKREDVAAIVVTGSGRVFSAGADLADEKIFAHDEGPVLLPDRPKPWLMRTPIIGALNGSAIGMGYTIPLTWDIRFMAEDGKYQMPFSRLGIYSEGNVLWLLPRMIGHAAASELLLTGRMFDGREAARLGMAHRALPANEVVDAAMECAYDIAENTSKYTVGELKERLYQTMEESNRDTSERFEVAIMEWIGKESDALEGVRSFKERRAPNFKSPKRSNILPF